MTTRMPTSPSCSRAASAEQPERVWGRARGLLFCAACLDASVGASSPRSAPCAATPSSSTNRGFGAKEAPRRCGRRGRRLARRVPRERCDEHVRARRGRRAPAGACPQSGSDASRRAGRPRRGQSRRPHIDPMRADLEEHLQMEATRRDAFQVDTGLALRGLRFEVEAARDETRTLKRKLDRALGTRAVIRAWVDPSAGAMLARKPRARGGGGGGRAEAAVAAAAERHRRTRRPARRTRRPARPTRRCDGDTFAFFFNFFTNGQATATQCVRSTMPSATTTPAWRQVASNSM